MVLTRDIRGVTHMLRTKDETSETIVHPGFLVGQNWRIAMLNHLVDHLSTQLNAETKKQASNPHICEFLGRLYSLILCG